MKCTHHERKAKVGIRRSQLYSRTQYTQGYTDRWSHWLDQHKFLQKAIDDNIVIIRLDHTYILQVYMMHFLWTIFW